MRKIIAIGESILDTIYEDNKPVKCMVGGRIANAAASLGYMQLPVTMVSECGSDRVGDMVIDFLESHGVDVGSVDRFTDGATAMSAIFEQHDGSREMVNYGKYPDDRFDVVWPRIDENDSVLCGSLYGIDTPQRARLFELVSYAAERKAIIVYLPGFQHGINFRITKVMTAILENLEIADVVVAHQHDINNIFPGETAEEAFHNHIEFYCSTYIHIHSDLSVSLFFKKSRKDFTSSGFTTSNLLGWQAGFTAGLIEEIMSKGMGKEELATLPDEQQQLLVAKACEMARLCATAQDNCLPAEAARKLHDDRVAAEAHREKKLNA